MPLPLMPPRYAYFYAMMPTTLRHANLRLLLRDDHPSILSAPFECAAAIRADIRYVCCCRHARYEAPRYERWGVAPRHYAGEERFRCGSETRAPFCRCHLHHFLLHALPCRCRASPSAAAYHVASDVNICATAQHAASRRALRRCRTPHRPRTVAHPLLVAPTPFTPRPPPSLTDIGLIVHAALAIATRGKGAACRRCAHALYVARERKDFRCHTAIEPMSARAPVRNASDARGQRRVSAQSVVA